jgi:hypothetical protein
MGSRAAHAALHFRAGLTEPTLSLRGVAGGTNPVANVRVGADMNHFTALSLNSVLDVSPGVLDARIGTLTVARVTQRIGTMNGFVLMGTGTLEATAIILGQNLSSTTLVGAVANGTMVLKGGTVAVDELTLSDNVNTNVGVARGDAGRHHRPRRGDRHADHLEPGHRRRDRGVPVRAGRDQRPDRLRPAGGQRRAHAAGHAGGGGDQRLRAGQRRPVRDPDQQRRRRICSSARLRR